MHQTVHADHLSYTVHSTSHAIIHSATSLILFQCLAMTLVPTAHSLPVGLWAMEGCAVLQICSTHVRSIKSHPSSIAFGLLTRPHPDPCAPSSSVRSIVRLDIKGFLSSYCQVVRNCPKENPVLCSVFPWLPYRFDLRLPFQAQILFSQGSCLIFSHG